MSFNTGQAKPTPPGSEDYSEPVPSNVVDIESARGKEQSSRSGKPNQGDGIEKKISVDLQFATSELELGRLDCVDGSETKDGEGVDMTPYTWVEGEEGHYWKRVNPGAIRLRAVRWLTECAPNKASSTNAQRCASFFVDTLGSREMFRPKPDENRSLAPMRNGVLEIHRDGTITAHSADPAFGNTYCTAASIEPDSLVSGTYEPTDFSPDSLFGRYILATLPDPEVRAVAQEALATVLISRCFEKAVILYGKGENGKSVMLKLLNAIFPNASYAVKLSRLTEGRFGTSALRGMRLLTMSELPSIMTTDAQDMLKAVVSQDPIDYEEKFGENGQFIPRGVFVIASNHHPNVTQHEHGFWRKLVTIPFEHRVRPEDKIPDLDKLIVEDPNELKQFVDWLLQGAIRLQVRGRFLDDREMPAPIIGLKEEQARRTNNVAAFVDEEDIYVPDDMMCNRDEIYRAYVNYCESCKNVAVSKAVFVDRLKDHLGLGANDMQRIRVNGVRETFIRAKSRMFAIQSTVPWFDPDKPLPKVEVHDAQEFFNITP